MRVLLVSTYDLGQQPVPLAAATAALRAAGHDVRAVDLAVDPLDAGAIDWADRVAVSVPMHTAMRLGQRVARAVTARRPGVALCFFGLYATTCRDLPGAGDTVTTIAGEFETGLVDWAGGHHSGEPVQLGRVVARVPARDLLPTLDRYTRLDVGRREELVGAVAASRGCAHRCRHCPVPVVYDGRVRPVDSDTVLADIDQVVTAGARHITFTDPDFLNAPHHARRVVAALHERHAHLTFDCTVKVEHILKYPQLWPEFAAAGCLFVVSAFESANDAVLAILRKGHTARQASAAVVALRRHRIETRPSWLPFTPWTAADDLVDLLDFVVAHDLVANVDPVQYTVRLLVPDRSLLLDDDVLAAFLGDFDPERLGWAWASPDPAIDCLQQELLSLVERRASEPADATFVEIDALVRRAAGDRRSAPVRGSRSAGPPGPRPRLTEPWFCCSEPTDAQLATFV